MSRRTGRPGATSREGFCANQMNSRLKSLPQTNLESEPDFDPYQVIVFSVFSMR
jgi:hypothetical protein